MSSLSPVQSKRHRVDWVLAATLFASGLDFASIAEQVGSKSIAAVKKGLERCGALQTVSRQKAVRVEACRKMATGELERASHDLKTKISGMLAKHAEALAKVRVAGNAKAVRQAGEALRPLVQSAAQVYDWGEKQAGGIIDLQEVSTAIVSSPSICSGEVGHNSGQIEQGQHHKTQVLQLQEVNAGPDTHYRSYVQQGSAAGGQEKEIPLLARPSHEADPDTPFDPTT